MLSFYDDRGRRIRQVTPSSADLAWTYDHADRVVAVTVTSADPLEPFHGTAVTSYRYDGDSRNPSELIDPEGGITRMRWDCGLLQEVVDPAAR